MIILKPIATPQLIKFIPTREGNANALIITNETTNEAVIQEIACHNNSYYCEFTTTLNLKEGHFYTLTLMEDDTLIHRDKIFCTAQDVDSYSVNKDEYVINKENIIFYE